MRDALRDVRVGVPVDRVGLVAGAGDPADAADEAPNTLPVLDAASVRRTTAQPMTFQATADANPITMIPVSRASHEPYTVYWYTDAYIP